MLYNFFQTKKKKQQQNRIGYFEKTNVNFLGTFIETVRIFHKISGRTISVENDLLP